MIRFPRDYRIYPILFSVANMLGVFGLADSATAQVPEAKFMGIDGCRRCHRAPLPEDVTSGKTKFVALTESSVWSEHDKHSRAYELIDPAKSELAKQMCELLGIDDITQAQQCLSCHADWRKGQSRPPHFARGVTCESCHGPSSNWEAPHDEPDWRKLAAVEKAKLGMVEVRDPQRRAEQCFTCHIGNVPQGKLVTHEMYAAGHPPLPGIELESFAAQMPEHWRNLSEKPKFDFREEFIAANCDYLADRDGKEMHRTKSVVVGGIVALRTYLQILAEQTSSPVADAAWPELASFHCAACHHDLKPALPDGPRQFGSPLPGRPPLHQWPTALVRIGLRTVAGEDEQLLERGWQRFTTQYDVLRAAVAARPFGERDGMQESIRPLQKVLDSLANSISQRPLGRESARQIQAELLALGQTEPLDFHTARQIAWAMQVVTTELAAPYAATDEALEAWPATVREPAIAKVDRLLETKGLAEKLLLKLPAGSDQQIIATQPAYLSAIAKFDPQWFRDAMQEFSDSLKSEP